MKGRFSNESADKVSGADEGFIYHFGTKQLDWSLLPAMGPFPCACGMSPSPPRDKGHAGVAHWLLSGDGGVAFAWQALPHLIDSCHD